MSLALMESIVSLRLSSCLPRSSLRLQCHNILHILVPPLGQIRKLPCVIEHFCSYMLMFLRIPIRVAYVLPPTVLLCLPTLIPRRDILILYILYLLLLLIGFCPERDFFIIEFFALDGGGDISVVSLFVGTEAGLEIEIPVRCRIRDIVSELQGLLGEVVVDGRRVLVP